MARFGKLNVLINDAGITDGRGLVEEIDEERWDWAMDVHAKGAFLGTKYAVPVMRKAGGGSVVNISSIAAIVARPAAASSNGAMHSPARTAAVNYAKEGIRCNCPRPYIPSFWD